MSTDTAQITTLAQARQPQTAPESFLNRLASRGPLPDEYDRLSTWICRYVSDVGSEITDRTRAVVHSLLGSAVRSTDTLLGHCYRKPHGYAGDFSIIDKIYTRHVASDECAGNWDRYFHSLAAPRAVRNRKTYFKEWLHSHLERSDHTVRLLNLASGPARDLAEFFAEHPSLSKRVHIDCVELDPAAIQHARSLVGERANVEFHEANVFRFRPRHDYDLVWSAGLFDYFDDAVFERVLRRFVDCLAPRRGELVVGNFDRSNPSLPQMLVQDWVLYHRTDSELCRLARRSGATEIVRVRRETEGVNLFLHVAANAHPVESH